MSHLANPTRPPILQLPSRRRLWVFAALVLAATAALVLVLSLGGSTADQASPVSAVTQPSVRADGGPDESTVATAVVGRPTAVRPEETAVAAAIGSSPVETERRPDESRVAAAVSGR
jgi:uncharacterized membrane protein YdfJ with MMPL/SSD domain